MPRFPASTTSGRGLRWPRRHWSQLESVTSLFQIVKATLAGTLAWVLAVTVFDSQLPFLAPWTAVLTVHPTVYRSLSRGLQTTLATVVGLGIAFMAGELFGGSVAGFGLALLIGLLCSRLPWLRDEGITIAVTALFVLASGYNTDDPLLVERLIEVAVGVAVGILVNLLVIPPLRESQARTYVADLTDRLGDALVRMADALETSWDTHASDSWIVETEKMTEQLRSTWESVRFARESSRWNPRRLHLSWHQDRQRMARRSGDQPWYEVVLSRLDESISQTRQLALILQRNTYAGGQWDPTFREPWVGILRDTGEAVKKSDQDTAVHAQRLSHRLHQLAYEQAQRGVDADAPHWPTYGALITTLSHIVDELQKIETADQ
ncbi:FUSC family protein [Citricoccus sp. NR2]|uniref:FUSC family protein n=1 Tax=Citricoccus sp. NR2 TaxID=3004095 RepID=UPI0022DD4806|nr:aromatic acid exporter family protein [Citricoccus sp. NR2]WBL17901.1 aromatic acid exporter family protein [Citricoccus sp. NR2]